MLKRNNIMLFCALAVMLIFASVGCFGFGPSDDYEVSLSASPEEGGVTKGEGEYDEGDEVTVEAIAEEGYVFEKWMEDDEKVSDEAEYTFEIEEDRELVANFEEVKEYEIKLSIEPDESCGEVYGEGVYRKGEEVTVEAKSAPDCGFYKWEEDGEKVSTDAEYTFEIESDRHLVAHYYVELPPWFQVSAEPEEGGDVYAEMEDDRVKVEAEAAEGYKFLHWVEDDEVVSTEKEYTFEKDKHEELVAKFKEKEEDEVTYKLKEDKIVVIWKDRPNSGYSIDIVDVSYNERDGILHVAYDLSEPEPGQNVLPVITDEKDKAPLPVDSGEIEEVRLKEVDNDPSYELKENKIEMVWTTPTSGYDITIDGVDYDETEKTLQVEYYLFVPPPPENVLMVVTDVEDEERLPVDKEKIEEVELELILGPIRVYCPEEGLQ